MGSPVTPQSATTRYYRRHASAIILRKTLKKVHDCGRIPRHATIDAHGIDRGLLTKELRGFCDRHPDTCATRRILHYLAQT